LQITLSSAPRDFAAAAAAHAVIFLSSEKKARFTGQTLMVNGGRVF
jgi:hypothetical protein